METDDSLIFYSISELIMHLFVEKEKAGISTRHLARLARLDRQKVARLFAFEAAPNTHTIMDVSKALGYSVSVTLKTIDIGDNQ